MTAVGLGYLLVDKLWLSKHLTTMTPDIASSSARTPARAGVREKSIAVLPFADLSEKKDQEYFADGMAEEVRNLLVKIPGLLVIGRASSLQLKGHRPGLAINRRKAWRRLCG
jgi:TolB-like protein